MMKWDTEAYYKLFAATIKIHDIKPNYEALAAEMGDGCTAKAITHKFAYLRSLAKGSPSKSPKSRGTSSSNSTPRAKGNGKAGVKKLTAKPKKVASTEDGEDEEDEEEEADDQRVEDYDEMDADDGGAEESSSPGVDRSSLRRATSVTRKRSYLEAEDDSEEDEENTPTPKHVKREQSIGFDTC